MERKLFQELKVESGGELEITPKLIWCFTHKISQTSQNQVSKPSLLRKAIHRLSASGTRGRQSIISRELLAILPLSA